MKDRRIHHAYVGMCTAAYLHGASLNERDLKVLPLPTLLHDVSEDDLAVPTRPG